MTSPDGITWTTQTVSAHNWLSITYGGGLFLAGSTDGYVMTSTDGITWTCGVPVARAGDFTYGNGLFVGGSTSIANLA